MPSGLHYDSPNALSLSSRLAPAHGRAGPHRAMRIHHIGIATNNIERLAAYYEQALGARLTSQIIEDEAQRVRVAFAELDDGALLELVEPLPPESPIQRILERGGGPYHICTTVEDIEGAIVRARAGGALVISLPRPAKALGGRRVAFLYIDGNNLIELLES